MAALITSSIQLARMIRNQVIPDSYTASTIMKDGGVILYPTDTIWGLGCDALNEHATHRIYAIKQRPRNKPFILLVESLDMLLRYVPKIHPRLQTLLAYHQRPLTVIHERPLGLPDFARSEDGSAAIRITQDPFCRSLISCLGHPIVSTSANRTSDPAPAHFGHITSEVIAEVDYVVQYRQDVAVDAQPSPIVRINEKAELIFLRS